MKLVEVSVKKFRSIIDSTPVRIEDDITCLVGKNESGKTSFLHALYRLNPARPNVKFKVEDQYPAWLEKKDRMRGEDINKFQPVEAKFEISLDVLKKINERFGEGVLTDKHLVVRRSYNDELDYVLPLDHEASVKIILKDLGFTKETRAALAAANTVFKLREAASGIVFIDENAKDQEPIGTVLSRIKASYGEQTLTSAMLEILAPLVPKFIYFDKYSSLPYKVNIKQLLQADKATLNDHELTALALLTMAGAEDDYILNPDYERRKRELENVANVLTQDVLKYWSQNRELRVSPDITLETVNVRAGQTAVVDELKIRIWDNKHQLSLPFDEHSTGFQWFFSFLAAFSEYEYSDEPVIILLDEPGLGLHGRAQSDFLKFIEERLADSRQVIYSTHSPFLVQPDKLERARIVEEKDRDSGSKITEDIFTTDSDTLFPLQGAIGYDLVQNLFISKNNLIVEGTSDFVYLTILSDHLRELSRPSLDSRWSIVPVGGADLIPTFVALLGNHLDVTVLLDSRKEGNQKLSALAARGYLNGKRIITIGEVMATKVADIEDLFLPEDYVALYNKTFRKTIELSNLKGNDSIVSRIARLEGVDRFDHGRPSDYFLRNKPEILSALSEQTLTNFQSVIEKINVTLGA